MLALSRLAFEDGSLNVNEAVLVIKATGRLMSPFVTHTHTIIHVQKLPIQYSDQ